MPVTIGVFVTPGRVHGPRQDASTVTTAALNTTAPATPRPVSDRTLPRWSRKTPPMVGGSVCRGWQRSLHCRRQQRRHLRPSPPPGSVPTRFAGSSAPSALMSICAAATLSTLVRNSEPKPLRIFLQDGSTDLNIYGGDWWMANQTWSEPCLPGYEVNHAWGTGGHSRPARHPLFPDAMRCFGRYGRPRSKRGGVPAIAAKSWCRAKGGRWRPRTKIVRHSAANAKGEVVLRRSGKRKPIEIDLDGKLGPFLRRTASAAVRRRLEGRL